MLHDAWQQPLMKIILNNINKETKSMRKESKIVTNFYIVRVVLAF